MNFKKKINLKKQKNRKMYSAGTKTWTKTLRKIVENKRYDCTE